MANKNETKVREEGCPCIAHNVELNYLDDVEKGKPIEFGDTSSVTGANNFSTLGGSPLWNGRDLMIPVTGIYYTEVSFVRGLGATGDDVQLRLFRRNGSNEFVLGDAWAGEGDAPNFSAQERKVGHFSIVTKLVAGDELYITGRSDGGKHAHVRNISWTTFHLCCNPGVAVPCPC